MMKTCLCRVVFADRRGLRVRRGRATWRPTTSHSICRAVGRFRWIPRTPGSPTAGSDARWIKRSTCPDRCRRKGLGEQPSLDTKWTGSVRPEVLQMPRYAPYREAGNFKMPFWLQPKHYFAGPAWYQRSVTIAPDWNGRRITLALGALPLVDHRLGRWPARWARAKA